MSAFNLVNLECAHRGSGALGCSFGSSAPRCDPRRSFWAGASDVLTPLTMMSLWLEQVHGKNYDFQSRCLLAGEHLHFKITASSRSCRNSSTSRVSTSRLLLPQPITNSHLVPSALSIPAFTLRVRLQSLLCLGKVRMPSKWQRLYTDSRRWPSGMVEHGASSRSLCHHDAWGTSPQPSPPGAELRLNARVAPSHEAEDAIEQMLTQLESAVAPYPLTVHDIRPPSVLMQVIQSFGTSKNMHIPRSSPFMGPQSRHTSSVKISQRLISDGRSDHSGTHDALVRFDEILHALVTLRELVEIPLGD